MLVERWSPWWKWALGMAGALLVIGAGACSAAVEQMPVANATDSCWPHFIKKPERLVFFHNSDGALEIAYPLSAREADITIYDPADLEQLAKLTNLRNLHLNFMGIDQEDISLKPLRGMKELEALDADNAGITDLSPLSGLRNLIELRLQSNAISDLRPLQSLPNLRVLWLYDNPITDLSPLSGLSSDIFLSLGNLPIPWDAWAPVAHIQSVSGGPPTENAGKLPCPPQWIRRLHTAYPDSMIMALDYDDFDGDGTSEAFAFLSQQPGMMQGWFEGKLLYLTDTAIEELAGGANGMYVNGYYRFGAVKIIRVDRLVDATTSSSLLWMVDQGKAREANLSGRGQNFHLDEYGNIRLLHSAYDGVSTGSGHSYKPYYFYFDGRDFVEYGAIQVPREQFLTCGNAQAILNEAETDGWQVAQILYRGRGMFHLNLRKPMEPHWRQGQQRYANRYMTLCREDNRLSFIDEDIGYYMPEMSNSANRPERIPVAYPSGWEASADWNWQKAD